MSWDDHPIADQRVHYALRSGTDGSAVTRKAPSTRPLVPPLESEIRDAKMSAQWKTGECWRGHDITDASNIRYSTDWCRNGWVRKRTCEQCNRDRKRGKLSDGGSLDIFGPRVCEICDEKFERTDTSISYQSWVQRKYCGDKCAGRAKRRRERVRPLPHPLSDKECASLRRMVGYDPDKDYGKNE